MTRDAEPAAEIIPERHAELGAGLGEAEESIAAITAEIAACSGTDLPAGNLASNVVFGAVGVKRGPAWWDTIRLHWPYDSYAMT